MKKITLFIIILLFALPVYAAEKTVSTAWDWPGIEAEITGFNIKNQHNVILDTVAPNVRQSTFVTEVADGGCITLYVVAVGLDGEESGNSNIINYCLPKQKTITVNSFSVTVE